VDPWARAPGCCRGTDWCWVDDCPALATPLAALVDSADQPNLQSSDNAVSVVDPARETVVAEADAVCLVVPVLLAAHQLAGSDVRLGARLRKEGSPSVRSEWAGSPSTSRSLERPVETRP
jgi:hypothetical protein